eukprot:2616123-Pleurochrysis_carterae.AAC.1
MDATAPISQCTPRLTVTADIIALPSDGVFRLDGDVEYDEQSQLAMQIFLATLLRRMPEASYAKLSRLQQHQVEGLARSDEA